MGFRIKFGFQAIARTNDLKHAFGTNKSGGLDKKKNNTDESAIQLIKTYADRDCCFEWNI